MLVNHIRPPPHAAAAALPVQDISGAALSRCTSFSDRQTDVERHRARAIVELFIRTRVASVTYSCLCLLQIFALSHLRLSQLYSLRHRRRLQQHHHHHHHPRQDAVSLDVGVARCRHFFVVRLPLRDALHSQKVLA